MPEGFHVMTLAICNSQCRSFTFRKSLMNSLRKRKATVGIPGDFLGRSELRLEGEDGDFPAIYKDIKVGFAAQFMSYFPICG